MKFNGPASRVVCAATLSQLVSYFRWQPYTIVAANSPESAACHHVLWQRCSQLVDFIYEGDAQ